jgi:hypothetical protein
MLKSCTQGKHTYSGTERKPARTLTDWGKTLFWVPVTVPLLLPLKP